MRKTRDIAPRRRLTAPELHDRQSATSKIPVDVMRYHAQVVQSAERQWGEGMSAARHSLQCRDSYLATYGEHEHDTGMIGFEWIAVTAYGDNCMCGYYIAWSPRDVHVMHDNPATCEAMFYAAKSAQQ